MTDTPFTGVYVDADGEHAWDDEVPYDEEIEGPKNPGEQPYTYRDLVIDRAEARGMTVAEYLEGDDWQLPGDDPRYLEDEY